MGNYHHNIQVLETGIGELIVARQPSQGANPGPGDFLPCTLIFCLGFFKKGELRRHYKTCEFKLKENESKDDEEKWQKIQVKSKLIT